MSRSIICAFAAIAAIFAGPTSAQTPKFGKNGGVGSATSVYSGGEPSGGTYSINGTTGVATLGGIVLPSQPAGTVLASPSASSGPPILRRLAPADIPTLNQNTTGSAATAGNVTGVVAIGNGGTGASAGGGVALDNVSGFAGIGVIKRTGAGSYSFGLSAGDVPTLNQNTTGNAATATLAGNVTGVVSVGNGGTGVGAAGGAALDNITGLTGNGFLRRQGTGSYSVGGYVVNGELNPMAAGTIKGNVSGSATSPVDVTLAALDKALPFKCPDLTTFGADSTGTFDSLAAFNAAIAFSSPNNICVYAPAGTYKFSATPTVTLGSGQPYASVMIKGDGAELTHFIYSAANTTGLQIIEYGNGQSFHIRDLSILAPNKSSTNQGILLQAASGTASAMQSDITGVTIRGSDGYNATNRFAVSIWAQQISNINFINDAVFGTAEGQPYASSGVCLWLSGTASQVPVQFNVVASQFNFCQYGIYYGTEVQGLSVVSSNFVGDQLGIAVPAGQTGNDQLSVMASQFNTGSYGIETLSLIDGVAISGNLFYVGAPNGVGIGFGPVDQFNIVGNNFVSLNTGQNAITIGTSLAGVITGNVLKGAGSNNFSGGVILGSGAARVKVNTNAYVNVATPYNDGSGSTGGAANSIGTATP